VARAGAAAFNVSVSGLYGAGALRAFRDLHGIPWVDAPLPYGAGASERFLKAVGRAMRIPPSRVRRAAEAAGRAHCEALEPLVDALTDMESQRHAVVIGDASHAPALAAFVREELGWVPELTVITNDLDEGAKEELAAWWERTGTPVPDNLLWSSARDEIREAAGKVWPGGGGPYRDPRTPVFVLGSSLDRQLAAELGAGHLSVSFPVSNRAVISRGYTGYSGGLALIEDIVSACVAGR
jgi:nitrogenase molybdenum-iron protein beta chain